MGGWCWAAVLGLFPSDTSLPHRVWVILMPRIPNPSKKFDELFITHNGNFQVRQLRVVQL